MMTVIDYIAIALIGLLSIIPFSSPIILLSNDAPLFKRVYVRCIVVLVCVSVIFFTCFYR